MASMGVYAFLDDVNNIGGGGYSTLQLIPSIVLPVTMLLYYLGIQTLVVIILSLNRY
jgi:hypothetical protein